MNGITWPETFSPEEIQRARSLVRPQPAPKVTGTTPTWPLVIEEIMRRETPFDDPTVVKLPRIARLIVADMHARDEYGRGKYATPITVDNDRDHLVDAYQEALDQAVYLRAAIVDSGLARYRGKLTILYDRAVSSAHELRLMIAHRDGEIPGMGGAK